MSQRDVASWNVLLLGLVHLGDVVKVMPLFNQMRVEGIQPDSLTVIGISQSITSREGVKLLKAIHSFGIRIGVEVDVSVSNTWVSSYAKVRDLDSAEKLFHEIDSQFITVVSWNSIIAGFQQEALFAGKLIHCHGIKTGCDSDITILNTLISMYSKCADLNAARLIFDSMMDKTCVTWTAMIGGYAEKGDLDEALTLFDSMEATGLKPDLVTILNLIAGCGETGALEIGRWVEKYAVLNGLKNNLMVLNALIDMYAKCGSLKEAREIFCKMHEKTVVSWTSMISGCALSAYNLFEMDPRAAAPYVEMANIYASEGRWDGVMDVRRLMKRNQVVKSPGQSVIQISGKSYKFTVEDRCHPNGSVIYEVLDGLASQDFTDTVQCVPVLKTSYYSDSGYTAVASYYYFKLSRWHKGRATNIHTPLIFGSTFHMDLNNVNHDVIELSSDSENEDNPSCDDSGKQLVLYDPSVHGGGEIESCPDPISYQPASYQPISYQPPYISRNNFRNQLQRVLPAVGAYTVQCANCFKWRLVPTQEKYEEIREHITQYPFVCERALEWGYGSFRCDDNQPRYENKTGSRLWAIDKPNMHWTPHGWH
ncbi:pentatricopeptide repeat-containing protein [Tanacetum coccineum]